MRDERYELFDELSDGRTAAEKAIILELLKVGSDDAQSNANQLATPKFLLSYTLALLIFFLELLRISVMPGRAQKVPTCVLFGSSAQKNSTNFHLQSLLKSVDRKLDILILDSPVRRSQHRVSDIPNTEAHYGRTIVSDAFAMLEFIRCTGKLRRIAVLLSKLRCISTKEFAMCLVRLLRGFSISCTLTKAGVTKLVFSLSGNACTSMIEQRLKGEIETIHWLHGVGLGFNFDSFADKTVVNNEYDHQFYSGGICGQSKFFPEKSRALSIPTQISGIGTIVVYSNLIHPSNEFYRSKGIQVEKELLTLLMPTFGDKNLRIRPHPVSMQLLGNLADDYLRFLEDHCFRLLDEEDNLVPENTLYISTVSTSFVDLIASGYCVFMYDKFASRHSQFQHQVNSALKFRDSASLNDSLRLFDSEDLLRTALTSFSVQSQEATFRYLLDTARS
jgi:hypothetical protein